MSSVIIVAAIPATMSLTNPFASRVFNGLVWLRPSYINFPPAVYLICFDGSNSRFREPLGLM